MFLVDSNCWMQFSLNSIALNMERRRQLEELPKFLSASTIGTDIEILRLDVSGICQVVDASKKLGLDYDDAYQFVAAQNFKLKIVSLDTDFDRIPNGRLTPFAALAYFREEKKKKQGQPPA